MAQIPSKIQARANKLLVLLHDLSTLRGCGPSDDPDEQTSVIESFKYILINIKVLSDGVVSSETAEKLSELEPIAIENIYDMYSSKAYLDAIACDIVSDINNVDDAGFRAPPRRLVSPGLINSLRQTHSCSFDCSRLSEYCREINSGYSQRNFISCLLLMRAVLNHVPPVFGFVDFSQVVANSGRSLKANFEYLDESLRKLGDLYTHQGMRRKEHLLTAGQIEKFGPQFELLLQEVLARL